MSQPATAINSHQCDYATVTSTLLDPPIWFYRKLKSSLAEKYPDSRENRSHDKPLRIQSSHFKFRIQNLRRHDQTGMFLFQIRPLVRKQKTNPVQKRSGFVTNPEKFPLE